MSAAFILRTGVSSGKKTLVVVVEMLIPAENILWGWKGVACSPSSSCTASYATWAGEVSEGFLKPSTSQYSSSNFGVKAISKRFHSEDRP